MNSGSPPDHRQSFCGASPRSAYQGKRFIRDDFFELILGRTGARDVPRPRLRRNMVDPVPTQCMMVDREFPRRPFDRRTGGKIPDSVPSENLFLAPSAFPAYVLQKICRVEKASCPRKSQTYSA